MTNNRIIKEPGFKSRVSSMLKLDFYRLFHTPAFFIMLLIAAIIPAMVLALGGIDMGPPQANTGYGASPQVNTPQMEIPDFENAWQMVESTSAAAEGTNPLDFAQFMNINMLFIFAGLLMSIFVAHDYSSGFVKSIFTVHSKKIDYVISKSAIGMFGGGAMIISYVFGTVIAGMLTGKAFDVDVAGLIFCLISKALLMGVFCSLFLGVAVFFKNRLWLTIVFTFLFGMMLYPAASFANLDSNILTVFIALIIGVVGALAFGAISTSFLSKRDLA